MLFRSLSVEQFRRLRPYLDLATRLGALVAQASPGGMTRVRIAYAGEPAELGTNVLRNAVLAGVLNTVLEEKVNLVNAGPAASARGIVVEEQTRRRERGFPDTIEVAVPSPRDAALEFSVEATVLHGVPRILSVDGIGVEAPLEGTLLFLRNRDVPGVIGQIGTILGSRGVNIATFALGRREAVRGAEAIALVRLDGEVSECILQPIAGIAAVVEARLVRL